MPTAQLVVKLDVETLTVLDVFIGFHYENSWEPGLGILTEVTTPNRAEAIPALVGLIKANDKYACTRDWHRHRTMYPLEFILVRNIDNGAFLLDPHYEPISEHGKEWHTGYWVNCRDAYEYFSKAGDWGKAMLCIPFGAQVELSCQMGLRDFLYTFELRAFTKGANFEYQEQARWALLQLRQLFEESGDLGRDIARGLQLPKGG